MCIGCESIKLHWDVMVSTGTNKNIFKLHSDKELWIFFDSQVSCSRYLPLLGERKFVLFSSALKLLLATAGKGTQLVAIHKYLLSRISPILESCGK